MLLFTAIIMELEISHRSDIDTNSYINKYNSISLVMPQN